MKKTLRSVLMFLVVGLLLATTVGRRSRAR